MSARPTLLALLLTLATAPACSGISETTQETIVNVLTLQRGTISELRTRRGTGPFRTYAVPPDRLLAAAHRAAGMARGEDGKPLPAIWLSEDRREVIAKERRGEDAQDDGYSKPFRSAMIAFVHPVPGAPGQSRVEVHAMHRGPFHRGTVDWERDMPRWIDAALREPAPGDSRISPLR